MNHDIYNDKFSLVVSCENTPYIAWQAKLFFFSCYSRLDHSPIIVVHNSGSELEAGYCDIIDCGGNVVTAPSYRLTKLGCDYPPRNTPGTLLHVAELIGEADHLLVLCDPDMIFVGLPSFPHNLSANFYSYVDFNDQRIQDHIKRQRLADKVLAAPVEKLRCGSPYVIPARIAGDLARTWIDTVDEFPDPDWVDMMYAFGLAIIKRGYRVSDPFDLVETDFDRQVRDGSIVHYCYGDDSWNKRHFMDERSIRRVWSHPVAGAAGTALGEIGLQLKAAAEFYTEFSSPQLNTPKASEDGEQSRSSAPPRGQVDQSRRRRDITPRNTTEAEVEILIACSTLRFGDPHRDRVQAACERTDVNWDLVYTAACDHKIAPLVYQNLRRCGGLNEAIPRRVIGEFENVSARNSLKNANWAKRIAEMAGFFDRRSHDLLLLKHAAFFLRLRSLFDVTMSDDIDGVVRPKGESPTRVDERYSQQLRPWHITNDRFRGALRWFIRDGRDITDDILDELRASRDDWQCSFGRDIEIEGRVHHDVRGVASIDFRRVWEDAKRIDVEGNSVCVPVDHDLIIINSVSLYRKPRLRLRTLVEINELIGSGEGVDWDGLSRKVRDYRCASLVYSALTATVSLLDTDIPRSVLKSFRPGRIRGAAIASINRKISPTDICRNNGQAITSNQPRSPRDLMRRIAAYNSRQLLDFLWLNIILRRSLGILKDRPSSQLRAQ